MVVFRKTFFYKKLQVLIWMKCTWWQPWFPQRQRVWPTLLGAEAWRQSGSPGMWWLTSCCSEQVGKPQQRYAQRYRWWKSSWCSWPLRRYQCRDEPVWGLCRCKWHRIPSSCASSSYLPWWCSSGLSQLSWQLFLKFLAACLLLAVILTNMKTSPDGFNIYARSNAYATLKKMCTI